MSKIGLDLRLFGTKHGGIGRYCQQLFPKILALDKNNQYFVFIDKKSAYDAAAFSPLRNLTFIETTIKHYSLGEQIGFFRKLKKLNLDLVHFPNFNVPILYTGPYVVTIHDMVHHKISGAKKSRLLHFLAYKKVISKAAKNCQKIITVSEASKKDIKNYLQVNASKIEVIYEAGALNPEIDQKSVEDIKRRYTLHRRYFLFVGVLERKKNLINLTRGFDRFLQKFKVDMDLVIAGKTDRHYPEIKHAATDIKNPSRLVFTSEVDDLELACLYKGAFAFASASLYEGFGLPGAEALNFALPLLVSNIEVFNEIYDNAAIYFNPADPEDIAEKMNLLVRDKQFYKQMQENSLQRSKIFSWNRAAKQTLQIYKEILGQ